MFGLQNDWREQTMLRKWLLWLGLPAVLITVLSACGFWWLWMRETGPLRFIQYLPGENDEYRLLGVSSSGEFGCLGGGLFSGHPASIDLVRFGDRCTIEPFATMNQFGADNACISADGLLLAAAWSRQLGGNFSGEIVVWSIPTRTKLWSVSTDRVNAPYVPMQFADDGSVLYSAGPGYGLHRWDARNGNYLGHAGDHAELIYDVDISPDGETIAAASFDSAVSLWNPKNIAAGERRVATRSGRLSNVRFSTAGNFAVVGAGDPERGEARGVSVWQTRNGALLQRLTSPDAGRIDFSSDGRYLLEAGGGILSRSYLRVWETSSWRVLAERKFSHVSHPMRLRILGSSRRFVVGWNNGTIELWEFLPDGTEG